MNNSKTIFVKLAFIIFVFSIALFRPAMTEAATLGFFIDKENPVIGDTLTADLKIDSEDVSINAAQATVKFPPNILQVQSVSKTDSVFNFWLTEPSFDNDLGQISFIGGSTTSGYSGKSLQILQVKFKVIGNGEASLVFSDTGISSADGSGSNVLSTSKGISFSVLSKMEINKTAQAQITREAEISSKLPAKPVLNVSLYPNPDNWHNLVSDFSASWSLPKDIIGVATALDKIPATNPTKSEGLFDNKTFKALSNGVWYLHVRFENNIGWGVTNHYRIAIDSLPPLPFTVEMAGNPISDNPTPEIKFASSDQFSSIEYYQILIDGREEAKTEKASYVFKPIPPGKHKIIISARDKAGNITEGRLDLEILPIQMPEILFINRNILIGEGGLSLNGSSIPSLTILYNLKLESGESILQGETTSNEKGFWSVNIDQPLKKNSYVIEITAKDGRGALSIPVKSEKIRVTEKPIIQIGKFQLGMNGALAFLLLVIAGGFGGGVYFYKRRQKKLALRILVVETDMIKVFRLIQDDIERLQQAIGTPAEVDDEFMIKRLRENIKKMEGYLKKEIEKIG